MNIKIKATKNNQSKLRTPDIAERLIESTNVLSGIKEYAKAGIYNIYPDFDRRSFFTL